MLVGEQPGDREDREGRPSWKPAAAEIVACRPWLAAELDAGRPRVIVCLGVTAARAVDKLLRVEVSAAARVLRTLHPSAVLRAPDHESPRALSARLFRDLRTARAAAARE